jgi:hypothetical protein
LTVSCLYFSVLVTAFGTIVQRGKL